MPLAIVGYRGALTNAVNNLIAQAVARAHRWLGTYTARRESKISPGRVCQHSLHKLHLNSRASMTVVTWHYALRARRHLHAFGRRIELALCAQVAVERSNGGSCARTESAECSVRPSRSPCLVHCSIMRAGALRRYRDQGLATGLARLL